MRTITRPRPSADLAVPLQGSPDRSVTCAVSGCDRDACGHYAGDPRCPDHYWRDAGPILRRLYRQGIDPMTGEQIAPALPEWWPIGVGMFTTPAWSWPSDYALLTCDTCDATWVGPRRGELCTWCRTHGERRTA